MLHLSKPGEGKKKKRLTSGAASESPAIPGGKTTAKVDQASQEGSDSRHAVPANFRRNNAGRQLIRNVFTAQNQLDKEKNPNNPVFHEGIEGMCRLKHQRAQGVTFGEVRERVVAHFDNLSIRNTPAWGQHVFSTFKGIQDGLRAGNRKVWYKFLVLVLETTAEAL